MRRFSPTTIVFILIILGLTLGSILSDPGEWLIDTLLTLPAIILGLSLHEFAHAYTAYKLGDMTPKFQGRVTMDPRAHIDPIGFISLMFLGFGWGRAVQINPFNFKNSRRDELIVSLSGVTMNLILAVVFSIVYRIYTTTTGFDMYTGGVGGYLAIIIFNIIYINIILMIFNLLPVPPLDGFGVVTEIFNLKTKPWYWQVYDNGFLILMALIVFDVTDKILYPATLAIMTILNQIALF